MRLPSNMDTTRLMRMLEEALQKHNDTWRPKTFKEPLNAGVEISPEQRDETVRWLAQLTDKFSFYPETYALSVHILDRFLHAVKARPKYLRCIGISCFYLAAKMHEEDEVIPGTSELVADSGCGCTVAEVLRMERAVLDKLHWDLGAVTALDFLHIFHALLMSNFPHLLDRLHHMTPSRQLGILTSKLRACLTYHQVSAFQPTTIALSIISLELEQFCAEWLPRTIVLQRLINVDSQELIQCRETITHLLSCYMRLNNVHMYAASLQGITKPSKRKSSQIEEDDIYDDIKRLYNEDGFDIGGVASITMGSCGSETRSDGDPDIPILQAVSAN